MLNPKCQERCFDGEDEMRIKCLYLLIFILPILSLFLRKQEYRLTGEDMEVAIQDLRCCLK
jgi:hypothetical protein